ncbi:hypothetical protein AB0M28_27385 [Streptomyces sp. NPDC051940]|uniref:hypothetical protein n=1 Tax=Streptomyces sp. NPDC051940 TaxID=3155675 RepID=UPI00341B9B5B
MSGLPAKNLRTLIPEYDGLVRQAVMLNPEPGDPGVRDSSLGGPLLWPAAEPWPTCAQEGHWTTGDDLKDVISGEVPMAPILQLYARDVPQLEFPGGTDVLQLAWCSLEHEEDPCGVLPRLFWRTESEVTAAGLLERAPRPQEGEYDRYNLPEAPSTLSPAMVEDYPRWLDLPQDLWDTWEPRLRLPTGGSMWPPDSNAIGTKVGGWPAWTQPANWPDCGAGHRMTHLLTITGDIQLGDCGGIYFFRCRTCPGEPWDWRWDCH